MIVETAFIGLAVATLFVELTGIYPGGIIVPAYVALFVDQPLRIVGTLVVALLAWGVYRLLARVFILFGRRRFLLLILLGGIWTLIGYRLLPMLWPTSLELRAIGWVIPGLIANTFERQGFFITVPALGIASAITYFILRLLMRL
ncbi:poly-gamma-glutamate biosynthesis protein PgsC [Candidatus Bipolaricaulota bacterium]